MFYKTMRHENIMLLHKYATNIIFSTKAIIILFSSRIFIFKTPKITCIDKSYQGK